MNLSTYRLCVVGSQKMVQSGMDRRIKVTALRDIPKGSEITIPYLPCNSGNTLRRAKIKKNWHFECQCERCCDTTELGTFIDAVKCQKCPEGHLLPHKPLDLEA